MPYQDGTFGCPAEIGIKLISGKWKPRIYYELLQQTRRFGGLQRLIPEVSRQVLTTQLRELEKSGLVQRRVFSTIPPKVEYSLTKFGINIEPILQQLVDVGEHYITSQKNVLSNREQ